MTEPGTPVPAELPSDELADDDRWAGRYPQPATPTGMDPVGVLACVAGFAGIVLFGVVLAIVAGVLGATAGQRARESGRSFDLAYLAFGLAALDGVVWVVLHMIFDLPFAAG